MTWARLGLTDTYPEEGDALLDKESECHVHTRRSSVAGPSSSLVRE
jgi:hypothetical protein